MDIATIVGVVVAIVIVFTVQILEGGSPASIILIPSMLLVFGGAFCAAMAGGVLKDATGEELSTRAMMEYFKPLMAWLEKENAGRQIGWD